MTPEPQNEPSKKPSRAVEGILQAEKLTQIAVILPASVFVGWLLGAWLDRHFHQQWIAIVGLLLGGAAGLIHVVRLVLTSAGKDDDSGTI